MRKFIFLPIVLIVISVWPQIAESDAKIAFIRDAETENNIRAYANPIFKAAGLDPNSVEIHLIHDQNLNAFVSGGQKIFINTGLLSTAEHVGQVIGVLAHETGHIAGGHIVRSSQAIKDAENLSMLSTIIGVGAGILSGRGDVATAAILGGQQTGLRSFLKFSRTQESSADHAALRLLDKTENSSRGMYEFMDILADQTLMSVERQDPYLSTHPLSQDRLITIEQHLKTSAFTDKPIDDGLQIQHKRIQAKIIAYSNPIAIVLNRYPVTDTSVWARYARAFAYYRLPNLQKALDIIDALIADFPEDPYFHELRGQMLFEHGRVLEGIESYKKSVLFAPPTAILYQQLGQAQLASESDSLLHEAEMNLHRSLTLERNSAFAWRQLAITLGRQNKMNHYHLALAEEALLLRKKAEALDHANQAERMFDVGSKEWIQAQDIIATAGDI